MFADLLLFSYSLRKRINAVEMKTLNSMAKVTVVESGKRKQGRERDAMIRGCREDE